MNSDVCVIYRSRKKREKKKKKKTLTTITILTVDSDTLKLSGVITSVITNSFQADWQIT